MIEKINLKSDSISCSDSQDSIKYTVGKKTFIVNPVYKNSGENISKILVKLMTNEVKKA